jgi:glycosyltransferase involved in cell wall biosynthesis
MSQSKEPKRILIFSLQYHPFIGGAEVAIQEITDRIPPSEIEFHMLTLRFNADLPKREKIGNVTVHRIGFAKPGVTTAELRKFPLHLNKHWYQLFAPLYAAQLQREFHFDGIWAMMAHSTGIPAGIFKTIYPEVKYLLTLQEGDPPEHIERIALPVWPLFARAFTTADIIQPISNFLASWARRRGAKGSIEVIPNGVEIKRFSHPFTNEKNILQSKYGKKSDELWLVTSSRLVPKNAVDTVIQALPQVKKEVIFIIAGIGPEETSLRMLAEKLRVEDRVRFLGHVDQKDLPGLLSISDIFIRPSRSEGMGISFIEAMAAGLPVVATHEGGIPDFLFDPVRNPEKQPTGFVVDKDKPEQIAEVVKCILANSKQTTKVTQNARKLVTDTYDWENVAGSMRDLFRRLLRKVD